MLTGFLAALAACFVWGLIFVIPNFLQDYSSLEIAFGRYFAYGVLSLFLLMKDGTSAIKKIPLKAWKTAALFGIVSNLFYYFGVVVGLRYATPPVTVLILGLCPILVAFYGNWRTRESSFGKLAIAGAWMAVGLALVNISEIDWTFKEYPVGEYLLGLVCVFASLFSWSWFAVHNAQFLKEHPDVPRSKWTTLLGVSTFFWVLVAVALLGIFGDTQWLHLARFNRLNPDTLRFFGGIAFLGVVCSWLGCYLWNIASSRLPISLMGPLIIFETVFGLFFVYVFDFRFPSLVETLGVVSMLGGIVLTIYFFRQKKSKDAQDQIN